VAVGRDQGRAAATGTREKPPPQELRQSRRHSREGAALTLNRAGLARARPTMACRATWAVGPPAEARPSPSNVPCWRGFFYFVLGRAACHSFRAVLVLAQQARPKLAGLDASVVDLIKSKFAGGY
jgi:hypothetical protein